MSKLSKWVVLIHESIVKGENIPEPGIPESFKVLVKELQSLGLDIKLYNQSDENEVELKEDVDDDVTTPNITIPVAEDDDIEDGMIIEDSDGNAIEEEEDEDDFGDEDEPIFTDDDDYDDGDID